jgi:hypothetical protein
VKRNNLTNGLVATRLLASPIVGAETEYPAADFKPKVIYQDTESHAKTTTSAVSQKQGKPVEVDSRYPAADFEPKVLYKDADYKPSKSAGSSSSPELAMASDAELSVTEKRNDESMMTYLLGLAVFGGVGYFFLSKRDNSKPKASGSQEYAKHPSGLSGVARYLRKHNMGAMTGVAKYLENQVTVAKSSVKVSGVEKYLEKQARSAKDKAVQAGTGVEKYMRNRG